MYKDIQSLLNEHLSQLPNAPTIAWENLYVEVDENEIYLEPHLFPSDTYYPELGENAAAYLSGIYQINVVAPKGQGWGNVADLVDSITEHFKRGTTLSNENMTLRISKVNFEPGIYNAKGNYVVPISIVYFSYYNK